MTQTRSVRATSPADLLALVPAVLGFHPEDSLVVMTVGEAVHRVHARVDLPTGPAEREGLAAHLVAVVRDNGVRTVALLAYTVDVSLAEVVVTDLHRRLRAARVEVVCAVRADGRRWWSLGRGRRAHPGVPYDVGSHPFMAEAVLAGTVVLGSRQELADSLVGTDLVDARLVLRLTTETARRLGVDGAARTPSAPAREHLVAEGRWVRHRVRRFLADGLRLDAHDVARLAVLMSAFIEVRDVAWAELTHANAPRHVDLWRDVVRRVPAHVRAAPAGLLGFAAWVAGNGALAWCAVDVAQEAEPGYPLAGLLAQTLAAAVPPAVWRPFPPDALTLFTP